MERVRLGESGVDGSKLFIGTGSYDGFVGLKQMRVKPEAYLPILRRAYQAGITFWDTAEMYRTHPHIALGLREFPRETLTISSKTVARRAGEVRRHLHGTLQELGTPYLDLFFIHSVDQMEEYRIAMEDGLAAFREAKQAGLIRAIGLSSHTIEILEDAAGREDLDVIFTNVNPFGVHMDAPLERYARMLERAKARGKGVMAHKTLGEGKLAKKHYEECLSYNLNAPFIDAVCVGVTSLPELEAAITTYGSLRGTVAVEATVMSPARRA